MDQYFEPLFLGDLAPRGSLVLCGEHFSRKKFICKDFVHLKHAFVESRIKSEDNTDLFVKLYDLSYHSLIFIIHVKSVEGDTTDMLMHYFDHVFLGVLEKHLRLSTYTVILALQRDRSGGLHVHVPGFAIAHDDYMHLCKQMEDECSFKYICHLICPHDIPLVTSNCNKDSVYVPFRLVSVESKEMLHNRIFTPRKIKNVHLKWEDSQTEPLFESIMNATYRKALSMMMPFPDETWPVLYYTTRIVHVRTGMGQITRCLNKKCYDIKKGYRLEQGGAQSDGSYYCKFVKRYSSYFKQERFPYRQIPRRIKCDDGFFEHINNELANHCFHLKDEPNPLQTILMNADFVVPVFFALCSQISWGPPQEIANRLVKLHKPVEVILNNASAITRYATLPSKLTFKTLLHCAFNANKMKEVEFEHYIGMGWEYEFEMTTSVKEMKDHLKLVQETHFPIVKHCEKFYAWDNFLNRWEIMEICNMQFKMERIYEHMTFFEGFSKIPAWLREELDEDKDWIKEIVNCMFLSFKYTTVESNTPPTTSAEMSKLYGINVPEYLFLELDLVADNEVGTK